MVPSFSLVDQLSQVLSCKKDELYVKLYESKVREQALVFLKLETIYLRFNRPVKFAGLTYSGARYLMVFRGFVQIGSVLLCKAYIYNEILLHDVGVFGIFNTTNT